MWINLGMGAVGAFAYLIITDQVVWPYKKRFNGQKYYTGVFGAIFLGVSAAFLVYCFWAQEMVTPLRRLSLSLIAGFSFETIWDQFLSSSQRKSKREYGIMLAEFKKELLQEQGKD